MSSFPHWIELSGLPLLLHQQTKGSAAWLVLRTIIDLDCATNVKPGTLDMPITELATRAGMEPADARKSLLKLQKLKLISAFIAEDDEENSLFKIADPFKTPAPHTSVKQLPTASACRYCDCPDADDYDPADPVLQEIVQLYQNQIHLTLNSFTIDKLRALKDAAPIEDIRRAFKHAEINQVRTLAFIVRRCLDYRKPKEQAHA